MQGFISSSRAPTYTLQNFLAATSKKIYRVADQNLTISFSNGSVLAPLDDIPVSISFPTDRFRFHTHEDFQAHRGLRGDLYGKICSHLVLKLRIDSYWGFSTNLHIQCFRCRWPLEAGEWSVSHWPPRPWRSRSNQHASYFGSFAIKRVCVSFVIILARCHLQIHV